ncbi:hypothetical protein IV204_03715 [Enterococcus faecalis]|nr:hypothetical protein [Enterococcus faecalis]
MTIADIVMLTATIIIWSLLIVNILLVIFGYVYYLICQIKLDKISSFM